MKGTTQRARSARKILAILVENGMDEEERESDEVIMSEGVYGLANRHMNSI